MMTTSRCTKIGRLRLIPGVVAFLLLGVLATGTLSAQLSNPLNADHITWDLLTPTVEGRAGESVTVRFRAKIAPTVKMYSDFDYPADAAFAPHSTVVTTSTSPIFDAVDGFSTDQPEQQKYDENFEITSYFWTDTVTFTVTYTIAETAQPGATESGWVNIYYMTCGERTCKPPIDTKLSFTLQVVE